MVKIISHTGCDIPLVEAQQLNIPIIPDIVYVNSSTFKNLYEISPESLYNYMLFEGDLPTSSHPSVGDFCDFFKEKSTNFDEILFLSVTSKMSGTFEAACTAKKLLEDEGFKTPIYIYDTLQCSHAMAMMVRKAYELASRGYGCEEIIKELDDYRNHIAMYFILDSLKYPKAGGRIGAIKALAADLMKIKPLLSFENGLVKDFAVASNYDDGFAKLIERFGKEADMTKQVIIFHQASLDTAKLLMDELIKTYGDLNIRIDITGPVIGAYSGPGGAGLAFEKK